VAISYISGRNQSIGRKPLMLRELTFDDSGLVRVELQQLYKERTKGVYYVGFMLFFLEIKLNFKGNCYKSLFISENVTRINN
jgi:hypothetical protein